MSEDPPIARPATRDDREVAVLSIVRAFAADPLVRWFFPDDGTYVQRASTFFGLLFDGRVDDGNVHVAGDGAAVSMWDPAGRWIDRPGRARPAMGHRVRTGCRAG